MDTTPVYYNNITVTRSETHKHLGSLLDKRLTFDRHVEEMILRANDGKILNTRLRRYLPRNSLLTIYKAFLIPHLDYGDVVYEYPENASFMQKLVSAQYNASLAITLKETPIHIFYDCIHVKLLLENLRQNFKTILS